MYFVVWYMNKAGDLVSLGGPALTKALERRQRDRSLQRHSLGVHVVARTSVLSYTRTETKYCASSTAP